MFIVKLLDTIDGKLDITNYYKVIANFTMDLIAKKIFAILATDFSKLSVSIITIFTIDFSFEE